MLYRIHEILLVASPYDAFILEQDGRLSEQILTEFPGDLRVLARAVPQYETLPGWSQPTRGVRSFNELPTEAKAYIRRLEELAGVPFAIISTGTDRHDTLLPPGSILDTWLDQ